MDWCREDFFSLPWSSWWAELAELADLLCDDEREEEERWRAPDEEDIFWEGVFSQASKLLCHRRRAPLGGFSNGKRTNF